MRDKSLKDVLKGAWCFRIAEVFLDTRSLMKNQNAQYLKRYQAITVAHIVSVLLLMLFAWPVLAQNDEDEDTDPAPGLDLFDEVNYSISQRWALGVGYHFVDLALAVDQSDYVQIYDIDFAGPMAYAQFRF